ncbi:Hypothetical_protein [Hexamita inflata]|uniref:Hypothetical_protein n=1 Tax=Hexamita inflata TaxID=28002 RepID=A0AA86N478_9EUKA|nr:Hypothetical protein HINF_LOCUS20 [Hexamita inflata]
MQPVSYSYGGNRCYLRFKVGVGEIMCFEVWQLLLIFQRLPNIESSTRPVQYQTADDLIQQLIVCMRLAKICALDPSATNAVLLQLNASRPIQLEKYRGLFQRHVARNETDVSWSPQKQCHCVDAYDLIQSVTQWRFGRKFIGFEQSLRCFRNVQLHQHN